MLSGTELAILKSIADQGGKSTISIVASKVGLSSDYARICCNSVGNADYIDVRRNGSVEVTPKGWQELDKRGWKKEEKEADKANQMQCPYCEGSNQPGAVFCVHCKRWLASEQKTYTLR